MKKIINIIALLTVSNSVIAFLGNCCVNNYSCGIPCGPTICNNQAQCGPFLRPLSDDYDSWKDNTKMDFLKNPECAPRNDSAYKGYLYKGLWWDVEGCRYWAFRNGTNNTITIEALDSGEVKDIPSGDVTNINRGESYSFKIQAPAQLFQLYNSDAHRIEIFVNAKGFIDYRAENPPPRVGNSIDQGFEPRF